ncbi:MAG: autotransporter outer membrane beta-barrel domain-containing protein [Nitrospirae bacterium]|nr:autotransporter outer membrane beta-barrel domain-containing protein [Nitrospirota bacterium]
MTNDQNRAASGIREMRSVFLHGGRMTKWKGVVVSMAPIIGTIAVPLMLAGALTIGIPGLALAANELGPEVTGADTITATGGDYGSGITYTNSDGLTLTLDGLGITVRNPGVSVISRNTNTRDIVVNGGEFYMIDTAANNACGIRARNQGSQGNAGITLKEGEIMTEGQNAHGLYAWISNTASAGTASITMEFGARELIATRGYSAHGAIARNLGIGESVITIKNGNIITAGDNSEAVFALAERGDASVEMTDGWIATSGVDSEGISAQADNDSMWTTEHGSASVVFGGGYIITTGDDSAGIAAQTDMGIQPSTGFATVIMNGGSIRTFGGESTPLAGAHGITAFTTGTGTAEVTINDGSIATSGDGSHGIFTFATYGLSDVNARSEVNLNGGSITTSGDEAHGVHALSTRGEVAVYQESSSVVRALGFGSDGLSAGGEDGVTIEVGGIVLGGRAGGSNDYAGVGEHGAGIHVASGVPSVPVNFKPNANPVAVSVLSSGYVGALSDHAIYMDGGTGTVINDGTITGYVTLWDNGDIFTNSSSNAWNIRNFQATLDPLVRDTENVAVSDFGGGDDTFANTSSGTIRLLTVEDMDFFTAETSDDAAPEAWLTSGVEEYFPDIANPAQASVMRPITVAGVEQAHLVNLETFGNAGLITMADAETGGTGPIAGDVIVITANPVADGTSGGGVYVSNGGALHIDTVLNDGVTDDTDVLVIDRAEIGSGPTVLSVTNAVSGRGVSTDINKNGTFDVDEGILVVQSLESGSSPEAFGLGSALIDGAWQYVLDQTDGQSWYLHSRLSPATPAYEVYPQTLLGILTLPTMQQRIGNRWDWMGCKEEYRQDEEGSAIWSRVEKSYAHAEPETTATGASYEQERWDVQIGVDIQLHESASGSRLMGGLTGHYGTSDTDLFSAIGDGSISTTGYGIGGTLSWLASDGFYVDGQGSVTWFESDLSSDDRGSVVRDNDGLGYALSLETGVKIPVARNLTVTPQAQLAYSSVDFDSFEGQDGESVSLDDSQSLNLRIGIAVDRDCVWSNNGGKQRSHLYAIANVYHEFDGRSVVTVSGTKLESQSGSWTGEVGMGFTRTFNDEQFSLYGEVNAATGLEDFGDSYRVAGTLGVRVKI